MTGCGNKVTVSSTYKTAKQLILPYTGKLQEDAVIRSPSFTRSSQDTGMQVQRQPQRVGSSFALLHEFWGIMPTVGVAVACLPAVPSHRIKNSTFFWIIVVHSSNPSTER